MVAPLTKLNYHSVRGFDGNFNITAIWIVFFQIDLKPNFIWIALCIIINDFETVRVINNFC